VQLLIRHVLLGRQSTSCELRQDVLAGQIPEKSGDKIVPTLPSLRYWFKGPMTIAGSWRTKHLLSRRSAF